MWASINSVFIRNSSKLHGSRGIRTKERHSVGSSRYPDIRTPSYYRGIERIQQEKEDFSLSVQSLPSVVEKLDAVNPYERNWTGGERNWHRAAFHDPLIAPRKAWRVCGIPEMYNSLPFHNFITKTHVIENDLPGIYNSDIDNISQEDFDTFEDVLLSRLKMLFIARAASGNDPTYLSQQELHQLFQTIRLLALQLFSKSHPFLFDQQIDSYPRLEAWWIRGGFHPLYKPETLGFILDESKLERSKFKLDKLFPLNYVDDDFKWKTQRIDGDHVERRGELTFVLRDQLVGQIRAKNPLTEFVSKTNELCQFTVTPQIYNPWVLGSNVDADPFFMVPGFEVGECDGFSHLLFGSLTNLHDNMSKWSAESDEFDRASCSAANAICFGSVIGQAHLLGFTQYNDVTYPFMSQLVLSDGLNWHFYAYQCNTIAINSFWEEEIFPCNLLWSKPMRLFESFDQENGVFEGLNVDVLKMLIKFVLKSPNDAVNFELTPYVSK